MRSGNRWKRSQRFCVRRGTRATHGRNTEIPLPSLEAAAYRSRRRCRTKWPQGNSDAYSSDSSNMSLPSTTNTRWPIAQLALPCKNWWTEWQVGRARRGAIGKTPSAIVLPGICFLGAGNTEPLAWDATQIAPLGTTRLPRPASFRRSGVRVCRWPCCSDDAHNPRASTARTRGGDRHGAAFASSEQSARHSPRCGHRLHRRSMRLRRTACRRCPTSRRTRTR